MNRTSRAPVIFSLSRSEREKKVVLVLLALTLLAACGKKGAPVPPGPSNEIVYPRQYPSR